MGTKRILIVEDDPDNQELLKEIITNCTPDYSYATVNDGEAALEIAEDSNFDLIFMDMSLPRKNGYEIVDVLRKSKNYQTVPIVALTAHAMNGIEEKVLDAGFSEYVAKPCKPKNLVQIIKKYLESKKRIILS